MNNYLKLLNKYIQSTQLPELFFDYYNFCYLFILTFNNYYYNIKYHITNSYKIKC